MKAEDIELLEAGAMFNPAWIARIEDLRVVRFMDWMATNNSPLSAWSDRPRPDDYTFAWRGAPVEVMVALANEIGADPWFTLPHQATDEHIRAFAEYVRDHLDPSRKAYVEYSNEVWNWIFGQTHWALAEAKRRWGADAGGDAWMQFAGMRAAQDRRDLEGGLRRRGRRPPRHRRRDPDRLARARAAAARGAALGRRGSRPQPPPGELLRRLRGHRLLRPPARRREGARRAALDRRGPRQAPSATPPPKFPPGPARQAEVERHRFDLATARAAADLRDGSVTGLPEGSVAHLVDELFTYHADVAGRHGLDLVMYEGGTHVVAGPEWRENAELTAFLMHLNYTPEMAALYATLLDGWRAAGGGLFNAFVDVAGPGKWGSWGALRHLDDANPRWDVLDRFNRETPAWWEVRPAGAFDNGVILRGSDAADEHHGTGLRRHADRRPRRRPLDRRRRRRPAAWRRRHRRRAAARRARRLPLLARRRRRPRRRPRRRRPASSPSRQSASPLSDAASLSTGELP